ncbi:MAG: helix-turn-helix domain-containing protein [Acutalibacteraceae bacterium]|nr:helix-turn-helix domain-containing protein [Acutalibacteraceae bacterium]
MYRKNDDILKNGYGIICKAVMTDERLSLTAKAIYAYLCSYTGSKGIVFPSRARILSELNISKNAYYKHFNQLVELDYITIKKRKNFLNRNQYIINDNPSSLATGNGIKALGYGIIPKSVMTNSNLTAKAKGLMAYFYSLAGNGTGAFPTKKIILKQLGISNTAYYNALHQLVENNYLTIIQRKSEGKFEQNEYIITNFTSSQNKDNQSTETQNQNTNKEKEKTQNTQNCDNNNNISLNNSANQPTPISQNQDIEDVEKCTPCTQKCDIQNCDNNNNNKVYNKNNISLNKYHISSSYSNVSIRKRSKSDKLAVRIKELCYYDDTIDSITDKSFKAIYNTAVTALISLATKPFTYREEKISENNIHNLIKLSTRDDTYGLSLRDLLYTVIEKFMTVKEKYTIHNITGYLKSMLYTEMLVGEF